MAKSENTIRKLIDLDEETINSLTEKAEQGGYINNRSKERGGALKPYAERVLIEHAQMKKVFKIPTNEGSESEEYEEG